MAVIDFSLGKKAEPKKDPLAIDTTLGTVEADHQDIWKSVETQQPETVAKTLQTARKLKTPPIAVAENLPAAQHRAEMPDFQDMQKKAPVLYEKMKDPQFAALAKGSIEDLIKIEQAIRMQEEPELTIGRLGRKGVASFKQGIADTAKANSAYWDGLDVTNPDDQEKFIREFNPNDKPIYYESYQRHIKAGEPESMAKALALSELKQYHQGYWKTIADDPDMQLSPDMKRSSGVIEDVVGAMAGSAPGMALSAFNPAVGTSWFFNQMYGAKYRELEEAGVDPDTANTAAFVSALGQAPLESAGAVLQLGVAKKFLTTLAGRVGFKVSAQGAIRETGKQGILAFTKEIGKVIGVSAAGEGFEEYLQNFPDMAGTLIAENPDATVAEITALFLENIPETAMSKEAAYSAFIGALSGASFTGGAITLGTPVSILKQKRKATELRARIQELQDTMSGLEELDRETFEKYVEDIANDDGTGQIFFQGETLLDQLMSTGQNIDVWAERMGVTTEQIREAAATGQDLGLSSGRVLASLKDDEVIAGLVDEMKVQPDDVTLAKLGVEGENQQAANVRLRELYDETVRGQAKPEHVAMIEEQLRASAKEAGVSGFTEENVRKQVALVLSGANAWAARMTQGTGREFSATDFFDMFNLTVGQPGQEVEQAEESLDQAGFEAAVEAFDDPVVRGKHDEVIAVANEADQALTGEAAQAVTSFIGHEPGDVREKGEGAIGFMNADRLENASDEVIEDLNTASEPVKDKLREIYGETVTLFRVQESGAEDKGGRKFLSWSLNPQFSSAWSGHERAAALQGMTDEQIAAHVKEFNETGSTIIGREEYVKTEIPDVFKDQGLTDYFEIFMAGSNRSPNGFVTDGDNFEQTLKRSKEFDDTLSQEEMEKVLKKSDIFTKEVPIDDIVWVSDRAGQSEFIVKNTGDFGRKAVLSQEQIEQELTEPTEMTYEQSKKSKEPVKTVKAYKLFRIDKKHPGKLFPLFVDAKTPVPMDEWIDATDGGYKFFLPNGRPYVPATTGNSIKVQELDKQTIQDLFDKGFISSLEQKSMKAVAYRPGWHAGDSPMSTHLGFDPQVVDGKRVVTKRGMAAKGQDQVWVEVEMPADTDWQAEADKRGTAAKDKAITDQIPVGGFYRYKTNPNMTGNWLIGGSVKINKILTDEEVAAINEEMGVEDLPRAEPLDLEAFGFNQQMTERANELVNELDGVVIVEDMAIAQQTFYSTRTWTDIEQQQIRELAQEMGIEEEAVNKWMFDIDNAAARVLADPTLDFNAEAADLYSALKPNSDPHYKVSLDFSTLCRKRYELIATIEAIQLRRNKALTKDMWVEIREKLDDLGYDVSCGACYVDAKRMESGKFVNEFIEAHPEEDPQQFLSQKNIDKMHREKPELYKKFKEKIGANNAKTPETRTDYDGEIREYFVTSSAGKARTAAMNTKSGLRWQSWSDFEVQHLMDAMQAILDMHLAGLMGHGYTKVPDFVLAMGNTGLMINMSLIAKGTGLADDGTLIFDSKEGMDFDVALELRDAHEMTAGTIAVGISNEHIKALLADPRIDYVIPYHASGLAKDIAVKFNMDSWEDFTATQTEDLLDYDVFHAYMLKATTPAKGKKMTKAVKKFRSKMIRLFKAGEKDLYRKAAKASGLVAVDTVDFWDDTVSGEENTARYMAVIEERGLAPKFRGKEYATGRVLEDMTGEPGYWKLLIDRKVYDHNGNNIVQKPVSPEYDTDAIQDIYDRAAGNPIPQAAVDEVVEEYAQTTTETFSPQLRSSSERLSINKTQAEGMLLNATVTEGKLKASGLGGTHYETHSEMPAEIPEGVTNATGFLTPDGKFLDRMEALNWLKKNRRDIYKALDSHTKKTGLESQDYANAELSEETDSVIDQFIRQQFGAFAQREGLQRTAGGVTRGKIDIKRGQEGMTAAAIGLTQNADLSTFLHESGHFFLEVARRTALQHGVGVEEWETIKEFLGANDTDPLTREQHEKWAEAFEQYLAEGNAPSVELRSAFDKFKSWLTAIYKGLPYADRVQLTDEIRAVMDSLLATEEEINEARAQSALFSILDETARQKLGETDPELLEYMETMGLTDEQAARALDLYKLQDMKKRLRDHREQAERDWAAETSTQAIKFIITGGGLDKDAFIEAWGQDAYDSMPKNVGLFKNDSDGVIETSARQYNMEGQEMVDVLTAHEKKADYVEQRAEELEVEYLEGMTGEDALHSARSLKDQLAQESGLLARLAQRKRILENRQIRAFAEELVSKMTPKDARNINKTITALRRARLEANKAVKNGDYIKAFEANEKARLNEAIIQAQNRAKDKLRTITNRWARIVKAMKKNPGNFDPDFRDQVGRLLLRFQITDKGFQIENDVPLGTFFEKLNDVPATFEEMIDLTAGTHGTYEWLYDEQGRAGSWQQLSYQEIQDIDDLMVYLNKQGRVDKKDYLSDGETLIADIVEELLKYTELMKSKGKLDEFAPFLKARKFIRKYGAEHIPLQMLFSRIDGYDTSFGGPNVEHLFNPLSKAQGEEQLIGLEMAELMKPIIKALNKSAKNHPRILTHAPKPASFTDPESSDNTIHWTFDRVISFALNFGNKDNLNKLIDGYEMSYDDALQVVSILTEEDWNNIQAIWDAIDTLWAETARVHKVLNGFTPKKVESEPFNIFPADTGGAKILRGGYYPLAYDSRLSDRQAQQDERNDILQSQDSLYGSTKTPQGFTISRLETAGQKPVKLSMSVLTDHLSNVAHHITHAIPLTDIDKLTRNKEYKKEIIRIFGKDLYETIRPALAHIANPKTGGMRLSIDEVLDKERGRATAFILWYNISVAAKQPFSLFNLAQAMGGVKAATTYILPELFKASNPLHLAQLVQDVHKLSPNMSRRFKAIDKELMKPENLGMLRKLSGKETVSVALDQFSDATGPALIRLMDMAASYPGWMAAFNKGKDMHGGDIEKAVLYADNVISATQPFDRPLDMAAMRRTKNSLVRFFTLFTGYTTKYANRRSFYWQGFETFIKTKGKTGIGPGEFLSHALLERVGPSLVMTMLISWLMHGEPPEDEDYLTDLILFQFAGRIVAQDVAAAVSSVVRGGYQRSVFSSPLATGADFAQKELRKIHAAYKKGDGAESTVEAFYKMLEYWKKIPISRATAKAEKILEAHDK